MERPAPRETTVGRICFRGDDRAPDDIFRAGFTSREPKAGIRYRQEKKDRLTIDASHEPAYAASKFKVDALYRYDRQAGKSMPVPELRQVEIPIPGDVAPETAVCVTPRFVVAALFPPDVKIADTWIYVANVQTAFNTHGAQVADGLAAVKSELAARRRVVTGRPGETPRYDLAEFTSDSALWPLFAQELATKRIEARHIIAAVPCRRAWRSRDWTDGAQYTLDRARVRFNRDARVPPALVDAVRAFLAAEPPAGTTPSRASGFHPSFTMFNEATDLPR